MTTHTVQHVIRQQPPWPPHQEATFMYSKFTCSCGWVGDTFRDVRGNKDIEHAKKAAEIHALKGTQK